MVISYHFNKEIYIDWCFLDVLKIHPTWVCPAKTGMPGQDGYARPDTNLLQQNNIILSFQSL